MILRAELPAMVRVKHVYRPEQPQAPVVVEFIGATEGSVFFQSVKTAAFWLKDYGYAWVTGTQGVWKRRGA